MRYQLQNGEIEIPAALQKAIDQKVEKIGKRLKRYHPDVAELEVRLSRQDKTKEYECSLLLKAFRDKLNARKSAPELRVAVDKSFEALLRELEGYRAKINKSLQAGD